MITDTADSRKVLAGWVLTAGCVCVEGGNRARSACESPTSVRQRGLWLADPLSRCSTWTSALYHIPDALIPRVEQQLPTHSGHSSRPRFDVFIYASTRLFAQGDGTRTHWGVCPPWSRWGGVKPSTKCLARWTWLIVTDFAGHPQNCD